MITQMRPAYILAKRCAEYSGLSIEDKAGVDAHNGDEFQEIDTGRVYVYDAENNEWKEKQSVGGSGGGTTNYNALTNKPSINGITLTGNKIADELGIHSIPEGGNAGQVLKKANANDYAVEWGDTSGSITADGVLVGDGAGNVTGRPFDDVPTVDSDNMLTSGAVYAAYSNVLSVTTDKLQTYDGSDKTDDVRTVLGIEKVAVLTGTLPAGQTVLGLTDSHITDDVTVTLYSDVYGVAPKSVEITNNTIAMTFEPQTADVNIRADVGNVTWTEPVQPADQGDMRKAVYDATGIVATGGGIQAYVNTQMQTKQDKADDSLDTTSKTVVGAINELKGALNAIGSVAEIVVVNVKPDAPAQNTLYYVGTASPYHIWLYTTQWYDMGTTDVNLNLYAKMADMNAALELKQDKLSDVQMSAVNSGVTAEILANKAGVDLLNVSNTVFKNKVETCGVILPAKPAIIDVTTIFGFYGVLYNQSGSISDVNKYAYIDNGTLVWAPWIASSNPQSSSALSELFEPKNKDAVFTDSAGQKWKFASFPNRMCSRNFANMYGNNTYYHSVCEIDFIKDTRDFRVRMFITSSMVNKSYGINFRAEIPLERVE